MKLADHLLHARKATWQIAEQIVFITIVDADVRIDGPEQDRIDPTVSLDKVVKITIDGVFSGDRIVEIAIFNHCLWLNECALRPEQLRSMVLSIIVLNAFAGRIAPGCYFFEPKAA